MRLVCRLAILSNASDLGWFIECLKVEDVEAPGESGADALLEERTRVLSAGCGGLVAVTT